jgi:hypothetical protein
MWRLKEISVNFQLRPLGPIQFNRELYGYKDKKYVYEGLIHKVSGSKLSSGCIIVSFDHKEKVKGFFKKHRIVFEEVSVWR